MEKKVVKKKVVKENKVDNTSKKKKKTLNYKEVLANEKFLLGVFILLAIIVCILGCFVIKEKNNTRVIDKTNIVIPILDLNTSNAINIDAYGLTKERFYVIKVVNYRNKKRASEEIEYSIDVENETKATIKLTKNDDETNLIKNNRKTVITGQKLAKEKKQEDIYYVSIVHDGGVKEEDFIKVTFAS